MKLIFFEEELLPPTSETENKIYTKEMIADLSDKKIGVILGNNGYGTIVKSMKKAVEEKYYAIISNQTCLLNMGCFIDEDGLRDIYMASLVKEKPLSYVEDYLERKIEKDDDLEKIYRDTIK